MTTIAQKYKELLSLSQTHILDEYESKKWLFTDPDTYSYYKKNFTRENRQPPIPNQHSAPQPKPPQQSTPTPPPKLRHHQPKPLEQPSPKPVQPPPPTPEASHPAEPQAVETKRKEAFTPEPLAAAAAQDLSVMQKLIHELFPEIQFLETPDDAEARRINQRWKKAFETPEVIILSFEHEDVSERKFLTNVFKAIDLCLAPTKIYSAQKIEHHNAWGEIFSTKGLKLIICSDYGMYSLSGLMKHYQEFPNKAQRYLGGIPVLLLTNVKYYLEQPNLKQALWKAINASLHPGL